MKAAHLLLVVGLVLVLTDRSSSFWGRKRRTFNPCKIIRCTHHKTREVNRDETLDDDVNSTEDDASRDLPQFPEADQLA